jgi:hypothetical protein
MLSAEMRSNIRKIQEAFAEHRPLSYQEWEDGFITDSHLENEIGIWLHAADTYLTFSRDELDPARRKDVYRVIGACLTGMYEFAMSVTMDKLKPSVLGRAEVEKIINFYFKAADT